MQIKFDTLAAVPLRSMINCSCPPCPGEVHNITTHSHPLFNPGLNGSTIKWGHYDPLAVTLGQALCWVLYEHLFVQVL